MTAAAIRIRPVRLGEMHAERARRRRRHDLCALARAAWRLSPRLTDRLAHWAEATPDRVFLADRGEDGAWRTITYRETCAADPAAGAGDARLRASRPSTRC